MAKGGSLTGEGFSLTIEDWTMHREVPLEVYVQARIEEGGFGGWFITRDGVDAATAARLNPHEFEKQIIGVKCGWLELTEDGRTIQRRHVYPSGSNFVSYLLSPQKKVLNFTVHEIAEDVLGIVLPQVIRS